MPPDPVASAAQEAPGWGLAGLWAFVFLAGVASPGPAPLPKVVSFLRNLSPSGPHVLPVGPSGALKDSIPAQSNCYQRWASPGREARGRAGAQLTAASGAFGDLERGGMRQRVTERQRETLRQSGGKTE